MGDFLCFKEHLMNGNAEEVRNNLSEEFVEKIVDNDGNFPIHIACRYGFTDVAKILLDRSCKIECETKRKWRPIHYACWGGHSEILKLLIGRGCNIECETKSGWRPIHWASSEGHSEILKLLIGRNCNFECETKSRWRPIHCASSGGHLEILKLLLDLNCNIECETESGWRPIHYASSGGHLEILKLLFDINCSIECKTKSGWRPIHYASWGGHSEILKLLLQWKCQISCKTKDGKTALDIAKQCSKKDCLVLLTNGETVKKLFSAIELDDPILFDDLFKSCNFIMQNLYTGLTILETAIENNATRIIKYILDKPIDNKEINDLLKELTATKYSNLMKECILYRCITYQHAGGFKKFNSTEVINGHCKIAGSSFLELAVEQSCDLFIDLIMRRTVYDKSIWIKAIDKATEKGFIDMQQEISERMILMESRQKVNFTILHTAICDNDADMVKYILDHPNIVDINSNNETLGTALALAHSLHHRKCIKVLQQYQLHTNTQNKYSQTPLHEAISNGLEDNCEYLIDRSNDIDQIGFMGLTGLHCAVIRGMINVCTQLVNRGADYVKYIEFTHQQSGNENAIPFAQSTISLTYSENALTLSMKFNGTLFPCFVERLDSIISNVSDGDNNSLLHLAVKCLQPDLCSLLLEAGAQVDSVNNYGNSPLQELFCRLESNLTNETLNKVINIADILIKNKADVSLQSNGINIFQSASIFGSEKLMLALVSNNPKLRHFNSIDFQSAFSNRWFTYAELLIMLLPDNFLQSNITREMFRSCQESESGARIIESLFDKSSSEMQQSIIESLLYDAVTSDNLELFQHVIQTEIWTPRASRNGETLFTFILREHKLNFAWKLLDSVNRMKFVKLRNIKKQIPLQIAIEIEEMELVNALIIESDEFDCEDADGKCALVQLMEKISITDNVNFKRKLISAIKTIIPLGGAIYKETARGQRIIDACTDSVTKSEIETFQLNYTKAAKEEIQPKERSMCNICMDNHVNIVFQCGHLTCVVCSDKLFVCPFCNADIITRTILYFS